MIQCNIQDRTVALASIYHGEKAEYFEEAMQSVLSQTVRIPIAIVVDGPLSNELNRKIEQYSESIDYLFTLEENVGLAKALQFALHQLVVDFDFVIRFDTDDVNLPNRFEKLVKKIGDLGADLIGSNIEEFSAEQPTQVLGTRRVPTNAIDIAGSVHLRNPFNHPSVAFRLKSALSAGGYEDMPFFEDWYLWAKMIKSGAKISNLPESLVRFRSGHGALSRRRGFNYARQEMSFFISLYKLGLAGRWLVFFVLPARLTMRLLPVRIFRWTYFFSRRVA
jgi:glycosyltransferase involved in cell wall biosynthesis